MEEQLVEKKLSIVSIKEYDSQTRINMCVCVCVGQKLYFQQGCLPSTSERNEKSSSTLITVETFLVVGGFPDP